MLLGPTGSGKSTLINAMINYIVGVQWKDNFRFKLIDEDHLRSQAENQTSEVTMYKINHQQGFKIDYSLTIIDSPGFGDTRSAEEDKEISEHLCNLFSAELAVGEVDAVCLVLQAALARLTPSQIFVFESVLSIAGRDVAENIRVLVTFADCKRPPVLEAINATGVPCPKTTDRLPVHFKFNNSALFAHNTSSAADCTSDFEAGGLVQMFWDVGEESMKRFFDALSVMKTKSLTMTKEVLRERSQLQNSVEDLQKQIHVELAKFQEINKATKVLKQHKEEINRNKNLQFEVTVIKPVQDNISGQYTTNCQQCHYSCEKPNDAGTISSSGYCTVCPGKCHQSVHLNQKYKFDYKEVKERQTVKELQEKCLPGTGVVAVQACREVSDGVREEQTSPSLLQYDELGTPGEFSSS
ncbi:hypothetical protein L3Q82_021063 [Scortum barcoo]|uniref:Uncharacterized protein n=1 Tax=Scortum barcoo TaxID=214431 RepID=A0ACB8X4J9_9TELE|nr:hypothetical protein L3Q82_021063 [Scortum barcoo]